MTKNNLDTHNEWVRLCPLGHYIHAYYRKGESWNPEETSMADPEEKAWRAFLAYEK